ncbi:degenerin deg-1-like [Lingula anatina]|uniref:Degenerin deg-1-like n=1 Tax=Lingula anatina TaxID=7574 RepID=A0A1S3KFQ5_LINAN|nr:degenerin deg-1-like [Lingula anatina]|eukprot:XP_013421470.1 degenerin deg-1-like [Lingula anatina]
MNLTNEMDVDVEGGGGGGGGGSVGEIWTEALENTTAHGLGNVLRYRNSKSRRIMWILLFLAGLGALIYFVSQLAVKYFEWPTETDVTVELEPRLDFPAVTICNENPVKRSQIAASSSSSLNNLLVEVTRNRRASTSALGSSVASISGLSAALISATGLGTGSALGLSSTGTSSSGHDYLSKSSRTQSLDQFQYQFAKLNDTERMAIGHNMTTFLVDCSWQGYPCDKSNFTEFSDYKYGNCFIFNSGMNKTVRSAARGGHTYGLSLELYIEQDEYIMTTESAGVRVTIHEQNSMPFAEEHSIVVAPGKHTSIGISKKRFVRIDSPYGDCKNYTEEENYELNAYSEYYNLIVNYSREACFKTCLQRQIIRDCGCAHPSYPANATALQASWNIAYNKNLTNSRDDPVLCNIANSTTHIECVDNIVDMYKKGQITCDCPPKCVEDTFEASVSSMRWPSDVYQMEMLQTLSAYVNTDLDLLKMRRNVLKVEIFYRDMNLETVTTNVAYSLTDLGSDLGGNLGLWLGVSVLTACELFNLILDVIQLALRNHKKNSKNNHVSPVHKITTKGF